jgi:hypothetical protein
MSWIDISVRSAIDHDSSLTYQVFLPAFSSPKYPMQTRLHDPEHVILILVRQLCFRAQRNKSAVLFDRQRALGAITELDDGDVEIFGVETAADRVGVFDESKFVGPGVGQGLEDSLPCRLRPSAVVKL